MVKCVREVCAMLARALKTIHMCVRNATGAGDLGCSVLCVQCVDRRRVHSHNARAIRSIAFDLHAKCPGLTSHPLDTIIKTLCAAEERKN